MLSFIKNSLLVLVLTIITGCAVSKEDLKNIKNVGVYSGLSDEMNYIYVGTTVFTNKAETKNVPEWDITGFSEQQMIKYLKEGNVAKKAGLIVDDSASHKKINLEKDLSSVLNMARDKGYDTAVILFPTGYEHVPFLKSGYGMSNRTMFGMSKICSYALFVTRVYNTHSQESLGWKDGLGGEICTPVSIAWKDNVSDYTPQELQSIEKIIKNKIDVAVKLDLKNLNLR